MSLLPRNINRLERLKGSNLRYAPTHKGSIIGRVLSVILDDPTQLGVIIAEPLFSTINGNIQARPFSTNIKHYPVKDEIVLISIGPSNTLNDIDQGQDFYYHPPVSLWSNNHHNKFPNKTELINSTKNTSEFLAETGLPQTPGLPVEAPQSDITEKANVHTLQPFPGDLIIEGRWGHSIRFGSTQTANSDAWWGKDSQDGDPILIITNGQKREVPENWSLIIEDIDVDDTAIYMTTSQAIRVKDIEDNFSIESFKRQQSISEDLLLKINTLPVSYTKTSRKAQDST